MKKIFAIIVLSMLVISCDYFIGPAGPAGPAGETGLEGAAGTDSVNYPGGILTVTDESENADGYPNYKARIVIDSDTDVLTGDETIVTVDLVPYINGGNIDFSLPWYSSEVSPGSYYIYGWLDISGDGVIDSGDELDSLWIFDPSSIYSITDTLITSPSSVLLPNYIFTGEFAPEVDITLLGPMPG